MAKKTTTKAKPANVKPKPLPLKKEGNAFDKIMKENIEKIFRPFIEAKLGITLGKAIPLKEKMQTTIELEMDFFYEIIQEDGEHFVLHLEFESGDTQEMILRVGEYHGMALRRRKLPIKHVVIYLGSDPPTMRTKLTPKEVYTGFDLINVKDIDTGKLLYSQMPETVIMAVLSNYKPEETEMVLRTIVENLKKLVKHKRTLKKYINQLMMLSRLRKIEALTIKIAEDMPIHFDFETDTLYKRGQEKGEAKGIEKGREEGREAIEKEKQKTIIRSWQNEIAIPMIANITGLSISEVEKVIAGFISKI